jgi:predicted ribosome quality control (RQC) complex YloA/Tae2 family protein
MQQLDALTLKALATELQRLLGNAKVSKVQHPSPHEFLITFWGGPLRPDNLNLFYIHLNPEAPFCVLTQPKQRHETVLQTFAKPTSLCMLLRKHLQGASLCQFRTLPGERVMDLVFENFNELGNKVRLVLSLELMGKHSNMIFYDEVQGTILAVAHGVSQTMSSHRELAAGLPYAPPPKPAGKRLLCDLTFSDFQTLFGKKPAEDSTAHFLNLNLAGFGLRMLTDALTLSDGGDAQILYDLLQGLENGEALTPAISANGEHFGLLKNIPLFEDGQFFDSVNALVGAYFIDHLRSNRIERKSEQLRLKLDQQEKKRLRREKELVPITDAEIESLQITGDRLLSAFSAREVPAHPLSGKGTVSLTHYEDGSPWVIEIDSSVGWVENAQLYYRRAKKAKARKDAYEQMAAALHAECDYLSSLKQLVYQAETLADLDALEVDMAEAGFSKKIPKLLEGKKKKAREEDGKELSGVNSLRSSDGLEILLGKSGQGNDAIVGKLSHSDDWWLHVHQMPGSHVLIRAGKEPVPEQTLLEAASLAAYYSSARNSLNVPVIYTQCKHVRKIPQSYPGHVNYRQEQTVFITPDLALIEKLISS